MHLPPDSAYEILGFNDIQFGAKKVPLLPVSDAHTTDLPVLSVWI
jgi:hypothetical protein